MSVEGQVVEESKQPESVSMEDFNKLKEQFEELAKSKDRILGESKEYKSRWKELQAQIESKEKQELESKENWKELLEKEKNTSFEYANKLKELKRESLKKDLNFEIAKHAGDAYSIDDVISAALGTGTVEFDEESLSVKGVKEAIDKIRQDKWYLFKKNDSPKMVNAAPKGEMPAAKITKEDALNKAISSLFKN